MKKGYYLIKHNNKLIPARWDGLVFNHEYGTSNNNLIIPHNKWQKFKKFFGYNITPMLLGCPNGCSCTTNSDGSTHVDCSPN